MKLLKYQVVASFLLLSLSMNAQIGQADYVQPTAPNMLLIEGGSFKMGAGTPVDRYTTVSTYYIEATEVWNKDYRDFVAWMQRFEPQVKLEQLLPDTSLWLRYVKGEVGVQLSKDYYRLTAFDYHPVVGVNWEQATLYCKWKTDRENKKIATEKGLWTKELEAKHKRFYTDELLLGDYGNPGKIHVLPNFRLPSEAEWEFAAWGLINTANSSEEIPAPQKFEYTSTTKSKGHFDKNIKKFRKEVEKHAKKNPYPSYYKKEELHLPGHIFDGEVNHRGAFNMNDNVSEWTYEEFRVLNLEEMGLKPSANSETAEVAYTEACPPTKLHHKASINEGDQSQFYTSTASFFNAEGKEISYQEFYQLKLKPSSPYQVLEVDKNDNVHIKNLSKEEYKKYKEREANRLNAEFIDKLNPPRVCKGANAADEQGKVQPGYRFSEREIGPYNVPIGFRCGMTRVGS